MEKMRPSDYANVKITEPTDATISINGTDDYRKCFSEIMVEYALKHFTETGKRDYNWQQRIYKLTDDEVYEMFNFIVDEVKKILTIPGESRVKPFDFELMVDYWNNNHVFLSRSLMFENHLGRIKDGDVIVASRIYTANMDLKTEN